MANNHYNGRKDTKIFSRITQNFWNKISLSTPMRNIETTQQAGVQNLRCARLGRPWKIFARDTQWVYLITSNYLLQSCQPQIELIASHWANFQKLKIKYSSNSFTGCLRRGDIFRSRLINKRHCVRTKNIWSKVIGKSFCYQLYACIV